MKKIARDKLDSRYSDIPHTILFASFLHPRTKNLVFFERRSSHYDPQSNQDSNEKCYCCQRNGTGN